MGLTLSCIVRAKESVSPGEGSSLISLYMRDLCSSRFGFFPNFMCRSLKTRKVYEKNAKSSEHYASSNELFDFS